MVVTEKKREAYISVEPAEVVLNVWEAVELRVKYNGTRLSWKDDYDKSVIQVNKITIPKIGGKNEKRKHEVE